MNSEEYPKVVQVNKERLASYSSNLVRRGLLLAQDIQDSYTDSSLLKASSSFSEVASDINALFLKGISSYQQGDAKTAIIFFDRLLEIHSNHISSLCFRGFALDLLGNNQKSLEDLARVLDFIPSDKSIHALYAQGTAYALMGNQVDARQRFLEILQIDIEHSSICASLDLYLRACTQYVSLDNKQAALQDCTQALLIDSNNLVALCFQGIILCEFGESQRAIEALTKALAANPAHIKADATLYARGLAYYQLNDFHRAIEDFSLSLAINHNNANSYLYRGLTYTVLGDFIQAEKDVIDGLKIDTTLYSKAIKTLDISFDYINSNIQEISHFFACTGDIHYELKNYRDAIEDYTYALSLNAENVQAYYNRELALLDLAEDENEDVQTIPDSLAPENYQSIFLTFLHSMARISRTINKISALDPDTAADLRKSSLENFCSNPEGF